MAVFAEHRAGVLRRWHVWVFWAGLVTDTTSTTLMSLVSGGFELSLHGVLGVLSILLMFGHTLFATIAVRRGNERVLQEFHKISLTVWALWMITLVTGFGISLRGMLGE
ncbi:MAG: HsmA family protein [Thermoleophilia bacterium]